MTEPKPASPEFSPPVSREAATELFMTVQNWAKANLALYFDNADSQGPLEYYNGIPYVHTPPNYAVTIPGDIICGLEPEAAAIIDSRPGDDYRIEISAGCYIKDTEEDPDDSIDKEYLQAYLSIKSRYKADDAENDTSTCMINIHPEEYEAVIDGMGDHGYARETKLTQAQCDAFQKIASRLDDCRAIMTERGLYPAQATPEILLHYRREIEIGQHAAGLVLAAEKEQQREERKFQDEAEQLQKSAEQQVVAENEARLSKVPVTGEASKYIAAAMAEAITARTYRSTAYAHVSRSEVEELRIATTERLLVCDRSLYLFDEATVKHVSRAFHNPGTHQTNVETISLKAETSPNGPIVTFTVAKQILTPEGLRKSVGEAYAFSASSYIKALTTVDSFTGNSTRLTHSEAPLNRAQRDVFMWLLEAVPPKQVTGEN